MIDFYRDHGGEELKSEIRKPKVFSFELTRDFAGLWGYTLKDLHRKVLLSASGFLSSAQAAEDALEKVDQVNNGVIVL